MNYTLPYVALWASWGLYWWRRSRDSKENVWRESLPSRLLHIVPLVLAALLLVVPIPVLDRRFVAFSSDLYWSGWLVASGGLAFAVWARQHLGTNWSGTITLKSGHELVVTGPYRWARHPIYTGLLAAFAGTALSVGEWRGVLAMVIVTFALWRKLKVEERGLQQLFGNAYDTYEQKVAALIPLVL
jgi:protein-S-isoprenylcysteine O-methyltransferase Ste14